MAVLRRTNEDSCLWLCPACGVSGVLTMEEPADRGVIEVTTAISAHHHDLSPTCPSKMLQRVVRPVQWYGDTRDLLGISDTPDSWVSLAPYRRDEVADLPPIEAKFATKKKRGRPPGKGKRRA